MDILSYIMGQKSSGSGGGDSKTTTTIYDGQIELLHDNEYSEYYGTFTLDNEPDTTKALTITLNGTTYEVQPGVADGNHYWHLDDENYIGIANTSIGYYLYMTDSYFPSGEESVTVSVKITQVQSGSGGGGGATTLVIYDADIVLEYQIRDNPYEGHFTPQTEPDTTQPVTIVLNGNTYTTLPPESDDNYYIWNVDVDQGAIGLAYLSDSGQCFFGATENYLPSTEHEQTLPLKITQVQSGSGGGGGSDFSIAQLSITNETSTSVNFAIPVVQDNYNPPYIEAMHYTGFADYGLSWNIALYKGEAHVFIDFYDQGLYQETTGNITWVAPVDYGELVEQDYFVITGDGTITITDTDTNPD